jgi:hypothetical protein
MFNILYICIFVLFFFFFFIVNSCWSVDWINRPSIDDVITSLEGVTGEPAERVDEWITDDDTHKKSKV